jgi:hypothetical protein
VEGSSYRWLLIRHLSPGTKFTLKKSAYQITHQKACFIKEQERGQCFPEDEKQAFLFFFSEDLTKHQLDIKCSVENLHLTPPSMRPGEQMAGRSHTGPFYGIREAKIVNGASLNY